MRPLVVVLALLAAVGCGGPAASDGRPVARLSVRYWGREYDAVPCFRVGRVIEADAGLSSGFDSLAWTVEAPPPWSTGPNGRFNLSYMPEYPGFQAIEVRAVAGERSAVARFDFEVHPADYDSDCRPPASR